LAGTWRSRGRGSAEEKGRGAFAGSPSWSEKIIAPRKRFRLSRAAQAGIFNNSPTAVQRRQQESEKPTGASPDLVPDIFH